MNTWTAQPQPNSRHLWMIVNAQGVIMADALSESFAKQVCEMSKELLWPDDRVKEFEQLWDLLRDISNLNQTTSFIERLTLVIESAKSLHHASIGEGRQCFRAWLWQHICACNTLKP